MRNCTLQNELSEHNCDKFLFFTTETKKLKVIERSYERGHAKTLDHKGWADPLPPFQTIWGVC